jgi:hypothetical protein
MTLSLATTPRVHAIAAPKLDLRNELDPLYHAKPRQPETITAPPLHYLAIDGCGDPNTSPAYRAAVEALFTVSYHLKFSVKKNGGPDYTVMPLEGLWWTEDMHSFSATNKASWRWTMMILQPVFITTEMVETAQCAVKRRKNDLWAVDRLHHRLIEEGDCVQILHVGPFSEEGPTVEILHRWLQDSGKHLRGKHHEIYLTDIRRTAPSRWKTIIRQPFE